MVDILLILATLKSMNVHGSKKQCQIIVDNLAEAAVENLLTPDYKGGIDKQLKELKKFKKECERNKK